MPSRSPVMKIGFSLTGVRFLFRNSTNSRMPPSYRKRWLLPSRSSSIVIETPAFRNASSRSRCDSVSKLNSVISKTVVSGLNVIFVPRFSVVPVTSSAAEGVPRS